MLIIVITYTEMSDFRYMRYFQRFNFCALSTLCDGSFSSTSIKYHSYSMPTPYTDIDSNTRWKMPVATWTCKLQIENEIQTLFSILTLMHEWITHLLLRTNVDEISLILVCTSSPAMITDVSKWQ